MRDFQNGSDLIGICVDKFNEKLAEQKNPIRLVAEGDLYVLRIAKKKNGHPKFDCPSKDIWIWVCRGGCETENTFYEYAVILFVLQTGGSGVLDVDVADEVVA